MNVNAYTNSFTTSENEKITTVRMPGIEIGKTTRVSVFSREAPSTRAASSSSKGMVLKNPIRSHVAKGTVNEGYTSTSDQIESVRCACLMTAKNGMKRSVGGMRY